MKVVISQSMYFPWLGFLEQLRLADIFVRYDDVQFSKGSFTNRVQIKTSSGPRWLTVPLHDIHLGQQIDQVRLNDNRDWRSHHREILRQAYLKSPFRDDMLGLVDNVFNHPAATIAELSYASQIALAEYFGLTTHLRLMNTARMNVGGSGSQRVLDIVHTLAGDTYITGHGGRNYLDHIAFEHAGISVQYLKYRRIPYPQLHGDFNPYVSALDLVANCGPGGVLYIQSETINWREFVNEPR